MGLTRIPPTDKDKPVSSDPFSAILPFLTQWPREADSADPKPSRYLVAKGLPSLPIKVVEKAWRLEFVDMVDFLPTPRSLRLAELGSHSQSSLQGSLVGAFNEFQAMQQQHQRAQRHVMDIYTWTRCFALYMAVMSKKVEGMIPEMVAHLHTVLRLNRKAPSSPAWREYDLQFRMEMAAKEDKTWSTGDPWQYLACLPGFGSAQDPFDALEQPVQSQDGSVTPPGANTSNKRKQEGGKGKQPAAPKRSKKAGVCRLLNSAPGGCPYGNECIFTHRCSNCGAFNDHGQFACPKPQKPAEK